MNRRRARSLVRVVMAIAALSGCRADGDELQPAAHETAEVELSASEGELAEVRLQPEAVAHLGIETTSVTATDAPRTRTVAGFVMVPPGRALTVSAAIAGTLRRGDVPLRPGAAVSRGDVLLRQVPLAPVDRDLRAQARRQRAATQARLELAQARLERLKKLVSARASSERAIEEATAELETARAEDEAARARQRAITRAPLAADVMLPILAPEDGIVRTISAAPGQVVPTGTPLFDVAPVRGLWVRVPVVPSELARVDPRAEITVIPLGGAPTNRVSAAPVEAPPSADPIAATVDLFYALGLDAPLQRPGERVMVTLAHAENNAATQVPRGAVVLDFDGGSWVYTCPQEGVFRRARVEVIGTEGASMRLRRGPPVGTCVVAVGALELLGVEFGVRH